MTADEHRRANRDLARVVVVGATGAGKSVLAQRLGARLGAEYVELDALYWDAGWTPAAPDVFRTRVERATAGPRWIVAGNYGRVRDLLWPRADTIVWLLGALPALVGEVALPLAGQDLLGLPARAARAARRARPRPSPDRAPAPAPRGGGLARRPRAGVT